jgi:hypothetical protein
VLQFFLMYSRPLTRSGMKLKSKLPDQLYLVLKSI